MCANQLLIVSHYDCLPYIKRVFVYIIICEPMEHLHFLYVIQVLQLLYIQNQRPHISEDEDFALKASLPFISLNINEAQLKQNKTITKSKNNNRDLPKTRR